MVDPENDNRSLQTQAGTEADFPSAEAAVESCITLERTPLLFNLLAGESGEELREELHELVRVFVPIRAPREKVRVVAKLIRDVHGTSLEDSVIVRDISTSGAQIMIAAQAGLLAQDLTSMTLRLRPPGQVDFDVEAHLARVIRADEKYIVVGVRFEKMPRGLAEVIHQITHVHSPRASQLAMERLSRLPATTRAVVEDVVKPKVALGPRLK